MSADSNYPALPPQLPVRGRVRRVLDVFWRIGLQMADMDTALRCAGASFFTFLSLFPALAVIVFAFGLLVTPDFIANAVGRLRGFVPSEALDLIDGQLLALVSAPTQNLSIGLAVSTAVALWSGSRGINALLYAVSRAHHGKDRRSILGSIMASFLVTLVGGFCLIVSLALIAALPPILHLSFLAPVSAFLLFLRWPTLLVLSVLGFAFFYRYAPDRRPQKARWIWPGAFIAAFLWIVVSVLFSFYVENFGHYDATFGTLTAAVILMLWIYNSILILVLGAVINAQLEYAFTQPPAAPH